MARRTGSFPCDGCRARHSGNHVLNGLSAFDIAAAVIEHAVGSKRRDVEVGIVEVQGEEISCLKVFDGVGRFRITPVVFGSSPSRGSNISF